MALLAITGFPGCTAGRSSRVVAPPACSSVTAETPLSSASFPQVPVPGQPFGAAFTPDGRTIFVSLSVLKPSQDANTATGVAVLHRTATHDLVLGSVIPISRDVSAQGGVTGIAVTHDGRLLLAADQDGVDVIDTSAAIRGLHSALVGHLDDPAGGGTFEIAISKDDRYVFATEESAGEVTVFDLRRARANHFAGDFVVNEILVPPFPVGIALAPDGGRAFVTTEASDQSASSDAQPGTLTVIDTDRADHGTRDAVVARVPA